jgi:hypothetical protein
VKQIAGRHGQRCAAFLSASFVRPWLWPDSLPLVITQVFLEVTGVEFCTAIYGRSSPKAIIGPSFTAGHSTRRDARPSPARRLRRKRVVNDPTIALPIAGINLGDIPRKESSKPHEFCCENASQRCTTG